MKGSNQIDIQILEKIAKNAPHKESYIVLEKSKYHRIGVGARISSIGCLSYFLEIFIYLCPNSSPVDVSIFEKSVELLKELNERGYPLCCQSDCNICSEITLASETLDNEYAYIKSIFDGIFPKTTKATDRSV